MQTELIGREGLFKAAPFQVAGCSFSKEPVVRPQAAFTPCGSRAWSPGCRQETWEDPVLGMLEPVFLGLPQPGSLCGGCERSVTLGAVQKHGVVQLSTPVPGRLFLSRPCFLRACPPLRLALASEPTGWGAGDPPRAWKDTRVDGPLHCFPSTSSPRSLGDEGTHDSPEQRCREGRTGVRRGQLRARVRAGCVVTAVGVQ